MAYYRRRLPHWIPDESAIFVTWRCAGPDRWLADPCIAPIVARGILYGEAERGFYELYAWVIMPDHVHVVMEPHVEFPGIMRWLKSATGRRANRVLDLTGEPFWQEESYDHWIRTPEELDTTIAYVEANPVRAGLAEYEEQWPWSSAGWKS